MLAGWLLVKMLWLGILLIQKALLSHFFSQVLIGLQCDFFKLFYFLICSRFYNLKCYMTKYWHLTKGKFPIPTNMPEKENKAAAQ